jgi:His-Xaa-Ser system protein HxsD
MSLAAAIAGLAGTSAIVADPAEAKTTEPQSPNQAVPALATGLIPNQIVSTGADLMGFLVTKTSNGTVLAQHASHASHSSHSSHYSSSR